MSRQSPAVAGMGLRRVSLMMVADLADMTRSEFRIVPAFCSSVVHGVRPVQGAAPKSCFKAVSCTARKCRIARPATVLQQTSTAKRRESGNAVRNPRLSQGIRGHVMEPGGRCRADGQSAQGT